MFKFQIYSPSSSWDRICRWAISASHDSRLTWITSRPARESCESGLLRGQRHLCVDCRGKNPILLAALIVHSEPRTWFAPVDSIRPRHALLDSFLKGISSRLMFCKAFLLYFSVFLVSSLYLFFSRHHPSEHGLCAWLSREKKPPGRLDTDSLDSHLDLDSLWTVRGSLDSLLLCGVALTTGRRDRLVICRGCHWPKWPGWEELTGGRRVV